MKRIKYFVISTIAIILVLFGARYLKAEAIFKDISRLDAQSQSAINWLYDNKITTGYTSIDSQNLRNYGPNDAVTRVQMVTFLYRLSGRTSNNVIADFEDTQELDLEFRQAITWAKNAGVTTGYQNGNFGPNDFVTRGQAAAFFYRLAKQPQVTRSNPFRDVNDSSIFYDAIVWLYDTGVTVGTSETTFSPSMSISREHMALFINRFSENVYDKILEDEDSSQSSSTDTSSSSEEPTTSSSTNNSSAPEDPETPEEPTTPENTNPFSLKLKQTGITKVEGIDYAIISADESLANLTFTLSGQAVSATAVNQAQTIYKIPLANSDERTLKLTQADQAMIVNLKAIGSSELATAEVSQNETTPKLPEIVLYQKTIPLAQYVKFIKLGGNLFVKSNSTLVGTAVEIIEEENETPVSTGKADTKADIVTSATQNVPESLDGKTKEATIAVQYDLIVNHAIAKLVHQQDGNTAGLLEIWDNAEKTVALSSDKTESIAYDQLGQEAWQAASNLPTYVKYLTANGLYGTKINFETGTTDSETAPELTIAQSIKENGLTISLSEANESWYLSMTEMSIPDAANHNTYYYQTKNQLSEDGKTMTIAGETMGPLSYVANYNLTVKAFNFSDVIAPFSVVETPPTFTATFEDTNVRLKLATSFSYYNAEVTQITVNDQALAKGEFISEGYNNLYIPYKYLQAGENVISFKATGYADTQTTVTTPVGFVQPKMAPKVTSVEKIASSSSFNLKDEAIVLSYDAEDEDQRSWLSSLAASHFSLKKSTYSTVTGFLAPTIDTQAHTISLKTNASNTIYKSDENILTIAVPGFELVTVPLAIVSAAPSITPSWLATQSLKLTWTDYSYAGKIQTVILDEVPLVKGKDYQVSTSSPYGIELFAHNFSEAEVAGTVTIQADGYAKQTVDYTAPANFVPITETLPELSIADVLVNNSATVQATGDSTNDWLEKINQVQLIATSTSNYVTTKEVSSGDYQINQADGTLTVAAKYFTSNTDNYQLKINATGYAIAMLDFTAKIATTITPTFNEGSWQYEFKAADNYYTYYTFAEENGVITVNGQPMTYQGLGNVSSTGYVQSSAGSARTLYISADLLTEETNTVTFSRNGYVDMTLSVAGKTPRLAAPTLSVDTVASSQKTITVTVSEDATEDWWSKIASLTTAGAKLTYGSSSTATISQLVANREERTLTITTSSNLSNYYTYQLVLAPSGYLPTSLSFKPA